MKGILVKYGVFGKFDLNPGLPIDARLGSSSVGTQLLFSHGQQTGRRLSLIGIGSTPIFELR
jgi:hypothetical protein